MSRVKESIEGLDSAIDLEHRVMEYYKRAGDEAQESTLATGMYRLEERHQIHIERLEAERERLHKVAGDGFLADAITAFGEALSDVVAGLPRTFIESETFPTLETLERCEQQLIELYSHLKPVTEDGTSGLIDSIISDCSDNISMLRQMDSLR